MANAAGARIRHDCSEAKRRIGIVDRRVTKSALNAHRLKLAGSIEASGYADDGIQFQKRDRHRRIVEVDCSLCDLLANACGDGIDINLQSDRKCSRRAHTWSYSTQTSASDRLVQLQCASPEGLVAEGVETKGSSSALDSLGRILHDVPAGFASVVIASSVYLGGFRRIQRNGSTDVRCRRQPENPQRHKPSPRCTCSHMAFPSSPPQSAQG
jgi:hypothetical protein